MSWLPVSGAGARLSPERLSQSLFTRTYSLIATCASWTWGTWGVTTAILLVTGAAPPQLLSPAARRGVAMTTDGSRGPVTQPPLGGGPTDGEGQACWLTRGPGRHTTWKADGRAAGPD